MKVISLLSVSLLATVLIVAGCRPAIKTPVPFEQSSDWKISDFIEDASGGVEFVENRWISHSDINGWECVHDEHNIFKPAEKTGLRERYENVKIKFGVSTHVNRFDDPANVMAFWMEICNPVQTNISFHEMRTLETQHGDVAEITYFTISRGEKDPYWDRSPTVVGAIALFRQHGFTHYHAISGGTYAWEYHFTSSCNPSPLLSVFHRLAYCYSFTPENEIDFD